MFKKNKDVFLKHGHWQEKQNFQILEIRSKDHHFFMNLSLGVKFKLKDGS
jgi:hypothetical protein